MNPQNMTDHQERTRQQLGDLRSKIIEFAIGERDIGHPERAPTLKLMTALTEAFDELFGLSPATGDARSNRGRCKGCKHWGLGQHWPVGETAQEKCGRIGFDGAGDDVQAFVDASPSENGLLTAADFGCVLFEEKAPEA